MRKSNSECECEEREIRDLTVAISPATVMSFFEGSLYNLEAGGSCSHGDLNKDKDDFNTETESGNASTILNKVSFSLSCMFVLLCDIDLDSVGVAPSPVLLSSYFFNQIV